MLSVPMELRRPAQSREDTPLLSNSWPRRVMFVEGVAAMGGVEWSTLYLAGQLDRRRWSPLVVCPEEGDLPNACRGAGIDIQILPRPALCSTSIRLGRRLRFPNPLACTWDLRVTLIAARDLGSLLADSRPELVVTKGLFPHLYGGLAARRAGIPCLWHAQDLISEHYGGFFRHAFAQLARWLPTRIVADGAPIVRQLPSSVQAKVDLIYNGVDTRAFSPGIDGTPVRRELNIPQDALVIGHVARMTPWKGQRFLLESFALLAREIPRLRLLFVGSSLFDRDTYERELRQRATAMGFADRVFFAGYRHDLPQVLAAMDLFAYPSVEKDTAPLALLSAMATGLPIVAFDIEGVREVLGGPEHGVLVPVEQVGPLAKTLARIIRDKDFRRQLARGARSRAEAEFSLEHYVRRFEQVFLELMVTDDSIPHRF